MSTPRTRRKGLCRALLADRRGGAAVELALALPLLATLMAGVTEIGRAIQYHQALNDGARAAVRYLSRVNDPCTQAEAQRAMGLVVTRSLDWSRPPRFGNWPKNFGEVGGKFEYTLTGCTNGVLTSQNISLRPRSRFEDDLGVLGLIGLGSGFWIEAVHEERFIGNE